MAKQCQLHMCNRFAYFLHFDDLFPYFCKFSSSSLVSMLKDREHVIKPLLTVELLRFRDGNSNILNHEGKTKILSYVSCFYPKCLAKIGFLPMPAS